MAKKSSKQVESSDLEGIKKEIRQASDRTAAIVLASWVERELEQWIVLTLPRQDKSAVEKLQAGALNSFYGKVHLGYALGLYDETTRDNLEIIRRVRNLFAHTPQAIDFETDEVRKEVEKLKGSGETDPDLASFSEARRNFTSICGMVVVRSRFELPSLKMELVQHVLEAISTHLTGDDKKLGTDASEKLSAAVEAFKKLGTGETK